MLRSAALNPEVIECSKDLYAILGSPFEGQLDPMAYQAELTLPIYPESPVFTADQSKAYCMSLVGRELDPTQAWTAEVGYLPTSDRLGFTSLDLPLKVPNANESLFLSRNRTGFVDARHRLTIRGHVVETALSRSDIELVFDPRLIDHTLANANYSLPQLFTEPDDLRLALAELSDEANGWSHKETVSFPVKPDTQVTVVRDTHCDYEQQPGAAPRRVFTTRLQAAYETMSKSDAGRSLLVGFTAVDHEVTDLELISQDIQRTSKDGEATDTVVTSKRLKPTPKLLRQLSEDIVDSMV